MAEKHVPRIIRDGLIALAFGTTASACNHSAPPAAKAPADTAAATMPAPEKRARRLPVQGSVVADTLTPEMLKMLRQYDFASLWNGQREETATPVMDGFFGQDFRRIAFVFTSISRDSLRPELFHVRGKDRFKKIVTPFVGELKVVSLSDLPGHAFLDMDSAASQAFTAKATFAFREERNSANAGEFTGVSYLDFFIDGEGRLQIAQTVETPDATAPARGAGVVFRGRWQAYSGTPSRPVVISNNVFMVAPEMLPRFGIGERSGQINPKYARLGWNDLMENDEWWADSPKPKLNL